MKTVNDTSPVGRVSDSVTRRNGENGRVGTSFVPTDLEHTAKQMVGIKTVPTLRTRPTGEAWRPSTWGDEISLEYGKSLKGYDSASGTVRVFGSNGPIGWTNKALAKGPGVILGRKGAYRGVQYSEGDFFVIDTAYYVVPKTDLDMRWLYYAIQYHKLGEIDDGSPIPSTTRAAVYVRELDVPPKTVQKEIARVLACIDDKIHLNRQLNQTLEQIAQAIFKSWFVDFEPVRAKVMVREQGGSELAQSLAAQAILCGALTLPQLTTQNHNETTLQNHIEQHLTHQTGLHNWNNQQLQTTAELFPNALVESELGDVPEGWEVKSLCALAENHSTSFDFSKVDKVVFVNTGDVSEGRFLHKNYSSKEGLPGQAKKTIKKNDILYSEIRPKNKRFAYVSQDCDDYVVSTKFMVIRSFGDIHPRYLYQILRQDVTIQEINLIAESRSGTFPQVTFDSIGTMPILVPPKNTQEKFMEFFQPIIEKVDVAFEECDVLSQLRDTLLPKLLSGEISLDNIPNSVGAE